MLLCQCHTSHLRLALWWWWRRERSGTGLHVGDGLENGVLCRTRGRRMPHTGVSFWCAVRDRTCRLLFPSSPRCASISTRPIRTIRCRTCSSSSPRRPLRLLLPCRSSPTRAHRPLRHSRTTSSERHMTSSSKARSAARSSIALDGCQDCPLESDIRVRHSCRAPPSSVEPLNARRVRTRARYRIEV